jgi:orotidine-5'-phosphate decarboxylase
VSTSRVILALDVPSLGEARSFALKVRGAVGMLKVGLELFVHAGPPAARLGAEPDIALPVFLDLKLHDIPETVDRAVARACQLGVKMLTVHAAGGRAMLRRAVERAHKEGSGLEIVAVTVLTSFDDADLRATGVDAEVAGHVERLGRLAWEEGVRAFVCSPREAKRLRSAFPAATLVTPGIRSTHDPGGDQKRTMTAREAAAAGVSWIVVGRPIRDAADPFAAAQALAREMDGARGAA